jgi:osmotically-inducible protein OsmY
LVFVLFLPPLVTAQASVQLDPFAQATTGLPACAVVKPRLYTSDEMRTEAHVRSERGTRCALEGTCEPGGAYKRDTEINDHVRAVIAADQRFTQTSIWITTSRKWVTLKGCVRTSAQRNALLASVRKQPNVERVFDELMVGTHR